MPVTTVPGIRLCADTAPSALLEEALAILDSQDPPAVVPPSEIVAYVEVDLRIGNPRPSACLHSAGEIDETGHPTPVPKNLRVLLGEE